ncbi:MAG: hypothetical protein IPH95_05930 [Candidatus Promineofilum sp.]|nr:hypothetical protein [Promineifilum sp.]
MTTLKANTRPVPATGQWIILGALAAMLAAAAVLTVLALAVAFWPDIALFKPLDSYARATLFTIIPAFVATGLFAWLAHHRAAPERTFLRIAAVVLLLSFIPDYLLPVPHRTILASSIAAFLHLIAATVIIAVLVGGYRRFSR